MVALYVMIFIEWQWILSFLIWSDNDVDIIVHIIIAFSICQRLFVSLCYIVCLWYEEVFFEFHLE